MGDELAMRTQLLHRIATRRAEIVHYVRRVRPWSNRLGTVSAVSSGLVAATTAGPAIGGDAFLTKLAGGGETIELWQGACLIALVVSVVSTLSSALLRKQDVPARVAAAESASAELGNLATALEFRRIDVDEAVTRFQQATASVAFVDEKSAAAVPAPRAPEPAAPVPPPAPLVAPVPPAPPAPATSVIAAPPATPPAGPAGPRPGPPSRPLPAWGPPPARGARRS